MSNVEINQEQFRALAENPNQEPFVMLNLLKFKKDGGRESLSRYIKEAGPLVEAAGAKVIFLGRPGELLQGKEDWDLVVLVQHKSRKAFLEMISNPNFLKVREFRSDELERSILYAIDPVTL